ncbi:hypothetical protein [Paenibacillus kribbensis]|uniref:hypothetical protein n=1 Tax=Paenibacillus kribbensis TaxID=172713 RepID=UPI00159F066F|nr:hypothetical protein [Paenibacillus kribbensis]
MIRLRNPYIQMIGVHVNNRSFIHMMIYRLDPDGLIEVWFEPLMQVLASLDKLCLEFRFGLI